MELRLRQGRGAGLRRGGAEGDGGSCLLWLAGRRFPPVASRQAGAALPSLSYLNGTNYLRMKTGVVRIPIVRMCASYRPDGVHGPHVGLRGRGACEERDLQGITRLSF